MSQQNKKFTSPYPENITDEKIFTISSPNKVGKKAYFNVRFAGNKIRITIYANVKDKGEKEEPITSILDVRQWFLLLTLLEESLTFEIGEKKYLAIKGYGRDYTQGTYIKEKYLVGKDKDGVNFLALLVKGKDAIKFTFLDDVLYDFLDSEGNSLSQSEMSKLVLKSYIEQGRHVIGPLIATEYVAKEDRPNAKGGKKGNKNYSSSNNYDSKSDDAIEDDIDEMF